MEVVLVNMQAEKLGDDIGNCPLGSENLCQLLDIIDGCFSDRKDAVAEPGDTDGVQFLDKESLPELFCQSWELLHN